MYIIRYFIIIFIFIIFLKILNVSNSTYSFLQCFKNFLQILIKKCENKDKSLNFDIINNKFKVWKSSILKKGLTKFAEYISSYIIKYKVIYKFIFIKIYKF